MYTAKKIEDENLFVTVQKLVTTRRKLQITRVVTDWEVASVKTAETDTLVTIDVVATDHRAENLVDTPAATRETVGVKIGMGIEIDMTIVAIDETIGITTTGSAIGLAALRGDLAVLLEPDWKEKGTIDTEDPDHFPAVAEIEISIKSGTMVGIAKETETETKENATINTRILCRRVSR